MKTSGFRSWGRAMAVVAIAGVMTIVGAFSVAVQDYEPGRYKVSWVPSPNFNDRKTLFDVDTIVLHHTVGDLQSSVNWLKNPESQVSAHFVITKEGGIIQMVPTWRRAWHAGASLDALGRQRVNDFSIGIEIVNKGDGIDPYTEPQLKAVEYITYAMIQQYPIKQIVSHEFIAEPQGRKNDPINFPWERMKQFNLPLHFGRKPVPTPPTLVILPDQGHGAD